MEVLREAVDLTKEKIENLNRRRGYQYLKLVRRLDEERMKELLRQLEADLRGLEEQKTLGHRKKWRKLADCQYPMDSYYCDFRPVFPYSYERILMPFFVVRPVT